MSKHNLVLQSCPGLHVIFLRLKKTAQCCRKATGLKQVSWWCFTSNPRDFWKLRQVQLPLCSTWAHHERDDFKSSLTHWGSYVFNVIFVSSIMLSFCIIFWLTWQKFRVGFLIYLLFYNTEVAKQHRVKYVNWNTFHFFDLSIIICYIANFELNNLIHQFVKQKNIWVYPKLLHCLCFKISCTPVSGAKGCSDWYKCWNSCLRLV